MNELFIPTDHQHFQMRNGRRSGLPVMIAIHSTALGPAIGGLRITTYPRASDAIADCLRLSEAMTMKAAAVDNGSGGGKAVVPLPINWEMTASRRTAILLDVADHVHELGGAYRVAPDVGTGPQDIDVIFRRTPYVGGRSRAAGGSGGTTYGTFLGVESAIRNAVREVLNLSTLSGLTMCIIGLGGVGSQLAQLLANEGVKLIVSDVDDQLQTFASSLGARWVDPHQATLVDCDVLVPCALGGILTVENVHALGCKIICGAANNQLASRAVAPILSQRNITYVPDFIANAGGLMYASQIELHHKNAEDAQMAVTDGIGRNVRLVIEMTAQTLGDTEAAALRIARERLWDTGHAAR